MHESMPSAGSIPWKCCGRALVALVVACIACGARAQEFAVVRDGVPHERVEVRDDWRTVDGRLAIQGLHRRLPVPGGIGEGDCRVEIDLSLDAIDGTAMSFVIDGNSHFGFDGRGRQLFVEGPLFGGRTRSLGASEAYIERGEPFEFVVTRTQGLLRFAIDGKVVHEQRDEREVFGTLALRPHRGTLRVAHFTVTGELLEDPYVTRSVQRHATVFTSGREGYATFRIPAIVRAANGDLLAFAEGRVNGPGDAGDIDLVLKRSTDDGATWSALQVVADHGKGTIGNPAPVVERDSGDVVLLAVLQPPGSHEGDIRGGRGGHRTPCVLRSRDHGRTWSSPRSLEESADRKEWRWYATGPCHAIQIEHGKHAGRLVVPANFSTAHGPGDESLGAHALLSDDGGRTWRIGAVDDTHLLDGTINPNESTVVELADGRLMFNARDQNGSSRATRLVAYSSDGGETFEKPYAAEERLVAPVCQASLLSVSRDDGQIVLFSGASDWKSRRGMKLRITRDAGRTWREGPLLYRGSAAYSDLVLLPGDAVGCLYEVDGYGRIVFSITALETILRGSD